MKLSFTHSTASQEEVCFAGNCDLNGSLVHDERSAAVFGQSEDFDQFLQLVERCVGNFAVVVRKGNKLWAAVDKVRSRPLFYGIRGDELFVSDDARWVRRQVGDTEPDPLAVGQMRYMLYVLGNRTISPNVRQLPAGEAFMACASADGIELETRRYYAYVSGPGELETAQTLWQELDCLHMDAFERLGRSVAGRQVVVPLSGGLDSRLLACMLKRMGHQKVLCFTYGAKGSAEAAIAQQVARTLGYPWQFVSYRRASLRDERLGPDLRRFTTFSANLHALPPLLEDWLAIKCLRDRGVLDAAAVFCPGHTAAFTSGNRALCEAASITNRNDLVEMILKQHSPRLRWQRPPADLHYRMRRDVLDGIEQLERFADGPWDSLALLEGWNWLERQSKRTVNMVRAYEFWGYDWALPLWDARLMDFWAKLRPVERLGKKLLREYLAANSSEHFAGVFDPDSSTFSPNAHAKPGAQALARKVLGRCSATRYFFSQKNTERMLAGSYAEYLRHVGRRILSGEPVTGPWLQMDVFGCEGIWDGATDRHVHVRSGRARAKVVFVKSFVKQFRVPFYQQLRRELASDGIEISLVFGQPDKFHIADSDVVSALPFGHKTKNFYWHMGDRSVCWQPALGHLRDADLVIVQQGNRHLLNYLLLASRRATGFRVALWGHGRNFQSTNGHWLQAVKNLYSTHADHWFAYTEKSRQVIEALGYPSEQITVVQNAIDARQLAEHYDAISDAGAMSLRLELGFEPGQPIGIYCGKFYGLKDVDFTLHCARQIHLRDSRFGLIMVGEGPEVDKVTRFCHENASWAKYMGPQYGRDKAKFFRLACCQLMPGAVGLSTVDSFAMLTPLITVKNPRHGPEFYYLQDGVNGIATDANAESYVLQIVRYLQDSAMQDRLIEGCRRARKTYTIENMAGRFADGIRTALSLNGSTRTRPRTEQITDRAGVTIEAGGVRT